MKQKKGMQEGLQNPFCKVVKRREGRENDLSQHIKSGEFKPVYLIYGTEDYLRKQYRDKMRQAIVGDDTMNYSYFEGKGISVKELIDLGKRCPFSVNGV